jgi:hypothetical protein
MQRNRFTHSFHAPTIGRYAILLVLAICVVIAAMSAAVSAAFAATGSGTAPHSGLDGTHSKPATTAVEAA